MGNDVIILFSIARKEDMCILFLFEFYVNVLFALELSSKYREQGYQACLWLLHLLAFQGFEEHIAIYQ